MAGGRSVYTANSNRPKIQSLRRGIAETIACFSICESTSSPIAPRSSNNLLKSTAFQIPFAKCEGYFTCRMRDSSTPWERVALRKPPSLMIAGGRWTLERYLRVQSQANHEILKASLGRCPVRSWRFRGMRSNSASWSKQYPAQSEIGWFRLPAPGWKRWIRLWLFINARVGESSAESVPSEHRFGSAS